MNGFGSQDLKPLHLVWLQTAFLGDTILLTKSIDLAEQQWPGVCQTIVCTHMGAELLGSLLSSKIDLFPMRKKGLGFFFDLYRLRYKIKEISIQTESSVIVIKAHPSFRSGLVALFLSYPFISFDDDLFSFFAKDSVARVTVFHEWQRQALLLEALGMKRQKLMESRFKSRLFNHTQTDPKTLKIGIFCGSQWKTKMWPESYFVELIVLIFKGYGSKVRISLFGSRQELELAQRVMDGVKTQLSDAKIQNYAGVLSLAKLPSKVKDLDFVISNDSSPTHLASFFDRPTLVIFGATVPEMGFGSLALHVHSELSTLPCRPCGMHGSQTCPLLHFNCMKTLTSDMVWRDFQRLVDKTGDKD